MVGVAAASLVARLRADALGLARSRARLARDLSLAEHLEEYQEVESFEFLDELVKSKLFDGPSP